MHKQRFANYWFEMGAPSFLISLLAKHYEELEDFKDVEVTSIALGPFEIGEEPLIPILFQAGYLTIAQHHRVKKNSQIIDFYTLRYPNLEVTEAFKKYMLAALTQTSYQNIDSVVSKFLSALKKNDIPAFCSALSTIFANILHQLHIPQEKYYHSLLQQICTLVKIEAESEVSTDKGRIDMVLQTKTHIFIFELKFNAERRSSSAPNRRAQILRKVSLSKQKDCSRWSSHSTNKPASLNRLSSERAAITLKQALGLSIIISKTARLLSRSY